MTTNEPVAGTVPPKKVTERMAQGGKVYDLEGGVSLSVGDRNVQSFLAHAQGCPQCWTSRIQCKEGAILLHDATGVNQPRQSAQTHIPGTTS